jgi:hypothetical protein
MYAQNIFCTYVLVVSSIVPLCALGVGTAGFYFIYLFPMRALGVGVALIGFKVS